MFLRLIVAICLLTMPILSSGPVLADLTDSQPSYTRIAAKCGPDPSQPSFSNSEYTGALADAAKALKEAKRQGNRNRENAISQQAAQVRECMEQEKSHYYLPKIKTCDEFADHFYSVSAWSAKAVAEGRIASDYRERLFSMLRTPAEECVRKLMSKCIDPNKASEVDDALRFIETAAHFKFILTYSRDSGLELFFNKFGPDTIRLKFCTDTDYACKGDPDYCAGKVARIKAMMQTYIMR